MGLGFNGLYGLVRERPECDPTNGHLYLFANSRCDRMKILYFDDSSLWVCARRMECGRLCWPEAEGAVRWITTGGEPTAQAVGADPTLNIRYCRMCSQQRRSPRGVDLWE
jgi:transposase